MSMTRGREEMGRRWMSQSAFTCSKSTIETPEQCVKSLKPCIPILKIGRFWTLKSKYFFLYTKFKLFCKRTELKFFRSSFWIFSFFKTEWTIAWNWDPSVATDWTTAIKNPRRISGSSEIYVANRYWWQPQYSSNYTTARTWGHRRTNSSSQTWSQNIQTKKTYQKAKTKDTSNRQVIWIFWRVYRAGKIRFLGERNSVLFKASPGTRCASRKFVLLVTLRGTSVCLTVYLTMYQMK